MIAATKARSRIAPLHRGVTGAIRLSPTSRGLTANTVITLRGSRTSRGKSNAPTPNATHTRKMAPPNTVPNATGAAPLCPAARPTATFSASKPERTAPTAKAESRSATDKLTSPSRSCSVAQIARSTPITNKAIPSNADIVPPTTLFFYIISEREHVLQACASEEGHRLKAHWSLLPCLPVSQLFLLSWIHKKKSSRERNFFSLPNNSYEIVGELGVQVCPPSIVLSRNEELLPCLLMAQPTVLETKLR